MRAQSSFFSAVGRGAGRAIPERTVAAAVRPLRLPAGPEEVPVAELASELGGVLHRLGLTLSRVRCDVDEAVALVGPRRPVLLVVRREERLVVVGLTGGDGPTVQMSVLDGDRCDERAVLRSGVAAELGIDDAALRAAFRVTGMGQPRPEAAPSLAGRPVRRLWEFLAPERTEIWVVVGFAIGLGVLTLATPIAVQALVNFVAFGGLMQPLVVVGLLLLFFLAFAGAIRVFKFYIVEVLQRRIFVRVVSDLSARLPRVRLDAFDRGHGPELVNRFFDVMTVQKAGSALLIDGLDILLQTGIGLLVLGFYHPFLLAFDVVLIVSIAFILLGLGRGAVATARKESTAKYAVAGALEELARAPVTFKIAGAPELARAQLAELAGGYIAARRKHYGVVFRQLVGSVTLHTVAGTGLLTLGGLLVIEGQLTLGQLVAAELIVSTALGSFVKFGKQLEASYDLMAGVDKLGLLFDLPLEDDHGESHVPASPSASLEFRDVTYRYPGRLSGVDGVSLSVAAHERVAVRGPRRSGKSTLAELVIGLRDADRGVVLFDGIDIRDVANDSIRAQIDLVKGFEIVSGSVLDNVRLGRSEVSVEEVRDALARFGVLDEMMELPEGLRTAVSSSGAPLSRCTAQMLMLARAVVGRPRAIVIDGILDDLDAASLATALQVLTDPGGPWTLLVFTRRDEVAAAMDRVFDLAPTRPSGPAVAPVAGQEDL